MPYGLTPMVPQTGFEPMTLAASTRCSTTELPRLGEDNGSRTRNNLIDSQVPLPFGLIPKRDAIPTRLRPVQERPMAEDVGVEPTLVLPSLLSKQVHYRSANLPFTPRAKPQGL